MLVRRNDMSKSANLLGAGVVACALTIALGGCAGSSSMNWWTGTPVAPASTASGQPIPRVQDCININSGTPSKYVCNGKTYTHHELRKIREEAAEGGSVATK
jgi:hypothetical protein